MMRDDDDNDNNYSDDDDGRLNRILIVSFPLLYQNNDA